MTLPQEMFDSIRSARHFMLALMNPKETPKVPKEIRKRARDRLKHFPSEYEIKELERLFYLADGDPNVLLNEAMRKLDSVRGECVVLERKTQEAAGKIIQAVHAHGGGYANRVRDDAPKA